MAEILTLAQARSALGWKDGQNPDRNDELSAVYIPATTQVMESLVLRRRWADYTETWTTVTASPVTTPWVTATLTVKTGTTTLTGWTFVAGVLTITDPAYTAGAELTITAAVLPVAAPVVLSARIVLAQLWNSDKQGLVASGSAVRSEPGASTPVGFAVPARAMQLAAPYADLGGFA